MFSYVLRIKLLYKILYHNYVRFVDVAFTVSFS